MNSKTGFFGKVPTHGDFIQYRCPREFIDSWDTWLESTIAQTKQSLGASWLDCYLTSPVYRFVLSAGLCGDHCWIGTLMPSVDKIGRYFPFTIFKSANSRSNPFSLLEENEQWFQQMEALTLSVLDDNFELSQLKDTIKQLPEEINENLDIYPSITNKTKVETNTGDTVLIRDTFVADQPPHYDYKNLLHTSLKETCHAYSIFTTSGSESVTSSLLLSQGLPYLKGTTALLDGEWEKWGWLNCETEHPTRDILDDPTNLIEIETL